MPEKQSKLMPALYGGIITGIISGVPFLNFVNCLCCAGVLLGGFMAVFFYKKDLVPPGFLTSKDSLQLGALSGVIGAVVSLVLSALLIAVVGNVSGEAISGMVLNFYESMGILDQLPPEAIDQMEEGMKDGGLSAMSIISTLIIYPIFGLLGGLIGYQVYKGKQGPVQPSAPTAVTM